MDRHGLSGATAVDEPFCRCSGRLSRYALTKLKIYGGGTAGPVPVIFDMCMENVTPLFAAMLKELDKRDGDGSALNKLSIIDDVLRGKTEPALVCVEMPDGINMEITGYYPITAEQFEAGLTRRSSRTTTVDGVKFNSDVSVIAGIYYQYTEIRLPCETVDRETGSLIRQIFTEMDAYYGSIFV